MKLGSETASVVNHLYSRMTVGQPTPVVGMGVTILHWTDRDAGTIFRVFQVGKSTIIEVRADSYQRTDSNGMSEEQTYVFKTQVNGHKTWYRQDKRGSWVGVQKSSETGRWVNVGGAIRLGQRDHYFDFSF